MKEIQLTQEKVALVDDDDYKWLSGWKWYAQCSRGERWYVVRNLNPGRILMHRLILNPPLGYECDHIDGNGFNNQRGNLRVCTTAQNQYNQIPQNGVSSKYKGVSRHKPARKWRVKIRLNGKQIHLGVFHSEIDAAKAYNQAAIKYFGDFARLNVIKES